MRIDTWSFASLTLITAVAWLGSVGYALWMDGHSQDVSAAAVVSLFATIYAPVLLVAIWAKGNPGLPAWPRGRIILVWIIAGLLAWALSTGAKELLRLYAAPGLIALLLLSWLWAERRRLA
jgi:hypothetical protein